MKADITKAKIEAFKFMDSYTFESPEDIRIEDIAMDQGLIIREAELKGIDARLVTSGRHGIITVNINDDPRRKRFSIAHEMGHWRLHRDSKSVDLCAEKDLTDVSDAGHLETEANIFASHVLMPRNIFNPMCRSVEPSIDEILRLAGVFNTSLTATALRFVEAAKENCILIYSEGKKVKWWRNERSRLFVETGWPVNQMSMAWRCYNGSEDKTPMKKIDPKAWFAEVPDDLRISVSEQAIRSKAGGSVLSLLWLFEEEKGEFLDM